MNGKISSMNKNALGIVVYGNLRKHLLSKYDYVWNIHSFSIDLINCFLELLFPNLEELENKGSMKYDINICSDCVQFIVVSTIYLVHKYIHNTGNYTVIPICISLNKFIFGSGNGKDITWTTADLQ